MKKEQENIEIRSNEVQEILGGVPSMIIRYGIVSIFFVFVFILVGSWFFQYPDILRSRIIVTTERPPATLIARASGQIENLLVEDNQMVLKEDILALIENPADYGDVLEIKRFLQEIQSFFIDYETSENIKFRNDLQLGSIQDEYSQFIKAYNDYLQFIDLDYYPRLNSSLEEQKSMSRIYYDRLWTQRQIMESDYNLSRTRFSRDSSLYATGVISLQEYEESESEMLSKSYEFEQVRTSLAQMQMDIIELDQRIIENDKTNLEQKGQLELGINEAYINLSGAISQWELDYVLKAPIDGTVTFNRYWSENQNVREGDRVLTIIPEDTGDLVGRVELPVAGSGKVKVNNEVNVKFDNYPYMEYGMVIGLVKNISLVPEDEYYMVEVSFPGGLVTSYGITLDLQNEILGSAEIITEELRLLQRFFNPLKALWNERITNQGQ